MARCHHLIIEVSDPWEMREERGLGTRREHIENGEGRDEREHTENGEGRDER